MTQEELLRAIGELLTVDLEPPTAAATPEECIPDNRYDTTALEASCVARRQANRAAEIRRALERYRTLTLRRLPYRQQSRPSPLA